MRTTIDLDDALLQRLRDTAHREGVPFKALLHRVILRGLDMPPEAQVPYRTPSYSMGQVREGIDLVKARWIAADLEDEEIIRKMAEGRQRVIIPDVNLLVYAVHAESEQHLVARAWLDQLLTGDEPVGFSQTVLTGFIRVSTNPRVVSSPARLDRAAGLVDLWLQQRIVSVVEPGLGHWPILRALLREAGRGGNLTTDAHLAALCIERGATLHSADGDFARFRGLRYENPLR